MSKSSKETPLMRQFNAVKAEHPEAILLFRVGDFYETFGDDAIKASKSSLFVSSTVSPGKIFAALLTRISSFPNAEIVFEIHSWKFILSVTSSLCPIARFPSSLSHQNPLVF